MAPSDLEESDVEGEALSNGAAAVSSDDSSSSDGDIDAELAQAADLRRSTSGGATSGSMPGRLSRGSSRLLLTRSGFD